MHIEHHPLIAEFPDRRDAIHTLKLNNHHFARLADEYEQLDKAVTRVENDNEKMDPSALEQLKKQRSALKDSLFFMLSQHA
jgi:uncharacterized protein YdcH (DUF465 family)